METQILLPAAMIAAAGETAGRRARRLGIADGLSLAAAPAFAAMALISGAAEHAQPAVLCSAMHGASMLTGMAPMYLLMSAFHLGPWLRLAARRRAVARRP
jgi:hypothetical protein